MMGTLGICEGQRSAVSGQLTADAASYWNPFRSHDTFLRADIIIINAPNAG
jgi:hypothetical protein